MVARLSQVNRIIFYATMILVSLLVLEVGFRTILAFWMGPRVLFYGSRFQRQTISLAAPPKANHTVGRHTNIQPGYTKYFPNESKIDHVKGTGETFKVSINTHGFRGREFTEAKKAGVTRIVTLGASSTFGFFDKDDETYPYYLEQRLNEDSPSKGKFEVINLGIPHLHSEEILALFLAEAIPLQPDVVTFYEALNDAVRGNPRTNESNSPDTTLSKTLSPLYLLKATYGIVRDHLVMVRFVDSLRWPKITELTFNKRQADDHITGTSEHFIGNVDMLYKKCQRRGITFVALKQQAKSYIVPDADMKGVTYAQEVQMVKDKLDRAGTITFYELVFLTHNILTTNLENWATSNSVPLVNIVKVLDQDRNVLLSLVHLAPQGNRMIADALAGEIKRLIDR
ncbi:MAG: hypothetical protein CV081_07665 [Nitrospira sp. LK265]|nr:SGNH/GDSL hydrolase family protein [Nitrospira sp.]NGZ60362.1 hypothetical protein [Nitrospira sp. LK265]